MLVAPAGFGKTIALKHFVERSGLPIWLFRLRQEHAEFPRFCRDFLSFVKHLRAEQTLKPIGACSFDESLANPQSFVELMLLALNECRGVIALDDLHVVMNQPLLARIISEIIDRSSSLVRWILATRSDHGFPVATWHAQGLINLPIGKSELRLTAKEIEDFARSWNGELSDGMLSELVVFSRGWPVAISFSRWSVAKTGNQQKPFDTGRELLSSYIEQQIFGRLCKSDQQFLIDTCLLPVLDPDALSKAGYDDAAAILTRISQQVGLLERIAEGAFRLDPHLAEFAESRLKLSGARKFRSVLMSTAQILETAGFIEGALSHYGRASDAENVKRLLITYGRNLVDRGCLEEVKGHIFSELLHIESQDLELVGLRADVLSKLGRFEDSNAIFSSAIDEALGDQRADLAQRFAVSLINQYRHDEARRVLALVKIASVSDRRLRCRLSATVAAAESARGRHRIAAEWRQRALGLASLVNDPALEAELLNSAAFVAIRAGQFDVARSYALRSVAAAEFAGLHNLAARAYSTLVGVASEIGDQDTTFENCLKMLDAAERAGDRAVARVALMGLCDLATERGDERGFGELEARLDQCDGLDEPRWYETLLPAKAMQLAWHGDYLGACDLLGSTSYAHANLEQQFLRRAEMAVYSAAGGLVEAAKAKLLEINQLERDVTQQFSRRVVKAQILVAICQVLTGQPQLAVRRLRALERHRMLKSTPLYALWRSAMLLACHTGSNDDDFDIALKALHSSGLGGFALLLRSLSLTLGGAAHRLACLTPTERHILRALSKGQTTKSIAIELNRSPGTIDTHVKAILRKLGCKGRIEAARIAREHGLS